MSAVESGAANRTEGEAEGPAVTEGCCWVELGKAVYAQDQGVIRVQYEDW